MTAVLEPGAVLEPTAVLDTADRRAGARATLGFGGPADSPEPQAKAEPLRRALKAAGVSLYPATALGILGIVDQFQAQAFLVLSPDIQHALGLSIAALGLARIVTVIAIVLAPMPMAALSQKPGRRVKLCLITGVAWSAVTVLTGFSISLLAIVLVLALDGLSTGSVSALHPPLVTDSYPATLRVRMLSFYAGVAALGQILSPLLVALLAGTFGLTWRGVFVIMGAISLLTTLLAVRLRDPGPGARDTELIHEHAEDGKQFAPPAPTVLSAAKDMDTDLGFFEIMRRLLLIPTIQKICAGGLVVGIFVIPYLQFLSNFLADRYGLAAGSRGLIVAAMFATGIAGLAVFTKVGGTKFTTSPAYVLDAAGVLLAVGATLVALGGLTPFLGGTIVLFCLGQGCITAISPAINSVLMSIVDGRQRPHAAALLGLFLAAGAIVGTILLSIVDGRFGTTGAIVVLFFPGVIGGAFIRRAKTDVEADLDAMITQILESEDIHAIVASGGRLPMLSARGVNFSYGQLQVLFNVDFTVDDGEMVALLGTNGAGKSTLLKVISGIGLPQAGLVRYRGTDITYLDAERRIDLGITQIPGGKAVFGPLDVIENLKLYGYTAKASKAQVNETIDRCLTVFPRLAERRTSLAATLSGGEQQMLALCKALILKPKLLLIDELSLGLAPIIVGQLLELVREINAEGTAVVLVEQSVNIALSLVDHAYFMEKGEMRFDGPAKDLLGREDLLRAVFLEGATKGTETASAPSGAKK